ncbi:hypothetical protein [Jiangella aurantiaca]|nr:hypothetical protein [Jiangella aurantiaca]
MSVLGGMAVSVDGYVTGPDEIAGDRDVGLMGARVTTAALNRRPRCG